MNHSIKKIISKVISLILAPLKYIVPKGNVIILQTYSSYIYCENTKYLFEYLSENTDYDVYWVTESKEIQNYLDSKGYKYITKSKIVQMIYVTVRAKIVIDSGSSYFNKFGLIRRDTTKITTMHGNGPKASVSTFDNLQDNLKEIIQINKFDYINFTSKYSCVMVGKRNYRIPPKKITCLGYPRCDQFFENEYVESRHGKKEVANYLLDGTLKQNDKIILYTPTWRPYDYDFPLTKLPGLNYHDFNDLLIKENIYFFFSLHTANPPAEIPTDLERIRFIDPAKFPLFDINLFMMEVDILFDDYSTTSTEFAILKRPQIFYMPDYEYYENKKGFVEDYRSILPGEEIHTFDEFKNITMEYLKAPETYLQKHENNVNLLLERYYDLSLTGSSALFTEFIHKIMDAGNYNH